MSSIAKDQGGGGLQRDRWGAPAHLREVIAALVLSMACGADAYDAPYVPPPGQSGNCGTLASITVVTRQALEGGLFDPVGREVKRVLVDTGQYRVLFTSAIVLMRQLPLGRLVEALTTMSGEGSLGTLNPAVFELVDYVTGASPAVAGEHYGVCGLAEAALRFCDPRAAFATLRRLLELEVLCSDCATGVTPLTPLMLRRVAELLGDPEFVAMLEALELDSEGEQVFGREAFELLIDLIIQNLTSPSFDWAYVRGLLDDALGRGLTGETRARYDALVDLVELLVAPELGVLPDLQLLIGCLYRHDEDRVVSQLTFDFAVSEELAMDGVLAAAADALEAPGGHALSAYLVDLLDLLERDARLSSDLLGAVAPLLGEQACREILPTLAALRGQGVATELFDAFERFLGGCRAQGDR